MHKAYCIVLIGYLKRKGKKCWIIHIRRAWNVIMVFFVQ
jgi:hypothetical protein